VGRRDEDEGAVNVTPATGQHLLHSFPFHFRFVEIGEDLSAKCLFAPLRKVLPFVSHKRDLIAI